MEVVVQNYISGEFCPAISNSYFESYEPSTGKILAKIPDSDEKDVEKAVQSAMEAFPSWSSKTPAERSKVMNKIADLIEARLEEFAIAECRDQGKTITQARTIEIPRAVYNFRFFATTILHTTNESTVLSNMDAINYTTHQPMGVAGLISPWNLPLYLLTFKIAPCIATGNTCVCKPSELTSITAWMMCKVFTEAGLPAGVVNMVFGSGPKAGQAIVSHPKVPLISFTGSTATGQKILVDSAPHCKKVSLELGGKNPALIFNDVDLEKCIGSSIRSTFANQGEICLCTSRIYVQKEIYQSFIDKFVAAARDFKVGVPEDPDAKMGALISKEHLEKVRGYIKLAKDEGAQIWCGEGIDNLDDLPDQNKNGYFMRPTVITGVRDDSRCMQEEIFGPVVCISPFDSEEEAVKCANDVKYGLCACLWTRDLARTHRVAQKLQVGTVWTNCWLVRDLNMPFGGTKASGIGREGAKDSIEFFTEAKTICIKH